MTASSDSAIKVAAPHEERVICEHADRCAGCPIIGLPYAEQLALKRGRVVQSLARYRSLELVYTEPVAPAQPLVGYRVRAKLIVAAGGRVGLYAKGGGHQVVDIPRCRVLAPVLMRVASLLRARIAACEASGGPLAPYDGTQAQGCLRAVDLREVRDGEASRALVTFVVQRGSVAALDELRAAARQLMAASPEVAGVAVNFHEGDGPQILGTETSHLAGASSAPDRVGASMHMATFGSFVQAHRNQANRVHSVLVEALGLGRARGNERKLRVLDLYGGSGAIALGLASAGASVRLVESFEPAVEQARAAASRLAVDVEVQCADAGTALRALAERGERFDAAVVNPPRRGTSPVAREWLARLQPQVIAYVSCDPETLARDLDHFARLGYAPATLRPLDMIPLTDEVETVAVLQPAGIPLPLVVYDDREILIVDKGPHEPTTPQGEYAGSLLARVRRIPGAERAVPVQRLDVGTSGLVTFARGPEYVARWDRVLGAPTTRKIYVAAVRGVIPGKGTITRELKEDGKPHAARTRYRRLAVAAGHSVVRVVPEQGRTHQIRRHLASIGYPVLGDNRYGHEPTNRRFEEKNALDRTFLHCVRLEFDHPEGGARRVVEAPLPGDLRAVLERTSGPGTLRFLDHKNALGTTGTSNLPPGPDEIVHDRGSAIEIRTSSPSIPPELTGDDDDRESGEY
jgi:23S rRNA (uracil1939-C5)-methyltransferase